MHTAAEIIEIIKVCHAHGVTEYKNGGIKVSFQPLKPAVSTPTVSPEISQLQQEMDWVQGNIQKHVNLPFSPPLPPLGEV